MNRVSDTVKWPLARNTNPSWHEYEPLISGGNYRDADDCHSSTTSESRDGSRNFLFQNVAHFPLRDRNGPPVQSEEMTNRLDQSEASEGMTSGQNGESGQSMQFGPGLEKRTDDFSGQHGKDQRSGEGCEHGIENDYSGQNGYPFYIHEKEGRLQDRLGDVQHNGRWNRYDSGRNAIIRSRSKNCSSLNNPPRPRPVLPKLSMKDTEIDEEVDSSDNFKAETRQFGGPLQDGGERFPIPVTIDARRSGSAVHEDETLFLDSIEPDAIGQRYMSGEYRSLRRSHSTSGAEISFENGNQSTHPRTAGNHNQTDFIIIRDPEQDEKIQDQATIQMRNMAKSHSLHASKSPRKGMPDISNRTKLTAIPSLSHLLEKNLTLRQNDSHIQKVGSSKDREILHGDRREPNQDDGKQIQSRSKSFLQRILDATPKSSKRTEKNPGNPNLQEQFPRSMRTRSHAWFDTLQAEEQEPKFKFQSSRKSKSVRDLDEIEARKSKVKRGIQVAMEDIKPIRRELGRHSLDSRSTFSSTFMETGEKSLQTPSGSFFDTESFRGVNQFENDNRKFALRPPGVDALDKRHQISLGKKGETARDHLQGDRSILGEVLSISTRSEDSMDMTKESQHMLGTYLSPSSRVTLNGRQLSNGRTAVLRERDDSRRHGRERAEINRIDSLSSGGYVGGLKTVSDNPKSVFTSFDVADVPQSSGQDRVIKPETHLDTWRSLNRPSARRAARRARWKTGAVLRGSGSTFGRNESIEGLAKISPVLEKVSAVSQTGTSRPVIFPPSEHEARRLRAEVQYSNHGVASASSISAIPVVVDKAQTIPTTEHISRQGDSGASGFEEQVVKTVFGAMQQNGLPNGAQQTIHVLETSKHITSTPMRIFADAARGEYRNRFESPKCMSRGNDSKFMFTSPYEGRKKLKHSYTMEYPEFPNYVKVSLTSVSKGVE